ncbi:MAG: hypothetical protein ACYDCY_11445 [Metallibacterium sp.]
MQLATCGEQHRARQLPVTGAVFVVEKAGQAVVAALHDVLRDARQVDAGWAGHARRFGTEPESG